MAIDRQKTETVHWHAVFTASRAEKKVRDRLEELGVECFLPVQTVLRQWTYRKSRVVVPVIAGLVKQMEDFRFLLDFSEEAVEMTNENIKAGDLVRVVKGSLRGMEGELIRHKGVTKVLVRIDMLGCAMVNIPASFVEKLNK